MQRTTVWIAATILGPKPRPFQGRPRLPGMTPPVKVEETEQGTLTVTTR
jgi:hypothetical protein